MEIRSTTAEDLDVFIDTLHTAFGRFPEVPVEDGGLWWSALEMDRGLLATTGDGRPVGTASRYSFELTLPGEVVVPAAGVTHVSVLPSHRRQGVSDAMMRHQLAGVRARGEFLAVLLATEAPIYRRFGYGPATLRAAADGAAPQAAFAAPRGGDRHAPAAGAVEVLRRDGCEEILEEVYDRYRRAQPGALSRPHRWWASGAGQPPISPAPRYLAVHRDADGVPDGYASYTLTESGTLTVDETIAMDDAVSTALARFVLDHDLVTTVVFKQVPPDHPLRWQLADFRAARGARRRRLALGAAAGRPACPDRARLVHGRRARARRRRPVPRRARPLAADRPGRQGRLRPNGSGARPVPGRERPGLASTSAARPRARSCVPVTSAPTTRARPPWPTPSSAPSRTPHCLHWF